MSGLDRRVIPGAVEPPGADILPGLRADDSERNRYIAYLGRCHAEGRIDGGVFNARLDAATAAVTVDQLAALTADLPPLVPARRKAAARLAGLGATPLGRRWLHITAATGALCWAFIIPVLIFTSTGFPVTYRDGRDTWVQIEHPGGALGMLWFFIVTGVVALVVDVGWWALWEHARGYESE